MIKNAGGQKFHRRGYHLLPSCFGSPLKRGGLVGYLVRPTVRPKVVMTLVLAELPDGVAEGGVSFLMSVD